MDTIKSTFTKKVNGTIKAIYPKTSSDVVTYSDGTVKDALDSINKALEDVVGTSDLATSESAGLMSADDKVSLDNLNARIAGYGVTESSNLVNTFNTSITGVSLISGTVILVRFHNTNRANHNLNVNNLGAKPIYRDGVAVKEEDIIINSVIMLVYDTILLETGSWIWVSSLNSNTTGRYIPDYSDTIDDWNNVDKTGFYTCSATTTNNSPKTSGTFFGYTIIQGIYIGVQRVWKISGKTLTSTECYIRYRTSGTWGDWYCDSLNGIVPYAQCNTATSTAAKEATTIDLSDPFVLTKGNRVIVKFKYANTAEKPTLNINGTGDKAIYYKGKNYFPINTLYTCCFVYDGTSFQVVGGIDEGMVTNTVNNTTKAYITGTTSNSTNTGTQVFDTGVYLEDTAGNFHADGTINGLVPFAKCSTAANEVAKVITVNGTFKKTTGARAIVTFNYTNTAEKPTLNVNGTGASAIYYRDAYIGTNALVANRMYMFMYDGSSYEVIGDIDTSNIPYGTCSTAAATADKVVSVAPGFITSYSTTFSNYGFLVMIAFSNTNTAENITLNINNTGAFPIYYRGSAIPTDYLIKGKVYMFVLRSSKYELIGSDDLGATMIGASADSAGSEGYAPAPAKGSQNKFLRGDATWANNFEAIQLTNDNLNNISSEGIYYAGESQEVTNAPEDVGTKKGFTLQVLRTSYGGSGSSNSRLQILTTCQGVSNKYGRVYKRWSKGTSSASWNDWYEELPIGRYSSSSAGKYSIAFGGSTSTVTGTSCISVGDNNTASSSYGATFGRYLTNTSYGALVTGRCNKALTDNDGTDNTTGDIFVIGNGTDNTVSKRSNAFRVEYTGSTYANGEFNNSGADYAEFVKEWYDGNPNNEDRVGYMVTIKNGKLYKANEGDYIIGITSGNPSIVGNSDEDYYWRYERDEFNRIVYENGSKKLSSKYNPDLQSTYVPRSKRPEWDYVGMRGIVPVRDDGTCEAGGFCKCGIDGIATKVDTRGFDTYYVIERINEHVISVEVK